MEIAQIDREHYQLGRGHISHALRGFPRPFHGKVLEIGPDKNTNLTVYGGWETLDINPEAGATYTADITQHTGLPDNHYDLVLCMDVLEHCLQPFDAVREILRILKPGGRLIAGSPWNFRLHGPIPDCWRFSQWGWQVLLKDFRCVYVEWLETNGRPLMPVHYNVSAYKPREGEQPDPVVFKRVEP